MTILSALLLAVAPEISWSIMHPTAIDPEYMQRVADKAAEYGNVDSFEVCGECGSRDGGIDGLIDFKPFPKTYAKRDLKKIRDYADKLNRVVEIAHKAGKPVYLWHREGHMPDGINEDLPALKDADGEYDLLGKTYLDFLKYKVDEAFRMVPGLDGIVLTLTEADISIVHTQRPDKYPPAKVVKTITDIFLNAHDRLGKRFIIRSFGQIASDYETIIEGAVMAADVRGKGFEIETKMTPYDFDPFLPNNPFLRHAGKCTIGAECDGLGEFLGAGYFPAAQVEVIKRYVDNARQKAVDRYTIRIDRVGNSVFDSAQEVNLYAYMRMIKDASATPEQIYREWAAKRWPKCADEMTRLSKMGLEMVLKTQFVDGHVSFHQNPPAPNFWHIKSCGIFSAYMNEVALTNTSNLWGMLNWKRSPGRAAILREKAEARQLAEEGLKLLTSLKDKLDSAEYARHLRAWKIARQVVIATAAYTRAGCAYFDDMERGDANATSLKAEIDRGVKEIEAMMANPNASTTGYINSCKTEGDNLDRAFFVPLRWLTQEFLNEFNAEYAERAELQHRAEVRDFVVVGGIFDDWKVRRTAMHASKQDIASGRPARIVGNAAYPNAQIEVDFKDIPGARVEVGLDAKGTREYKVEEKVANGVRTVTISKRGTEYPRVRHIALVTAPQKKLLAFGHEFAGLRINDLLGIADELDKTPLDGIGVYLIAKSRTGAPITSRGIMVEPRWDREALKPLLPKFREFTAHKCGRNSFIMGYRIPTNRVDWADDAAWRRIADNMATLGWFAREAGLAGIHCDPEDYYGQCQNNRLPGDLPYDELKQLVRRRGRETFGALFREFPTAKVLFYWLLSFDRSHLIGDDLLVKVESQQDVWPAFVDGILDVMTPGATLIDGCEYGYRFESAYEDYFHQYFVMRAKYPQLISPENRARYMNQVQYGASVYVDAYMLDAKNAWYMGDYQGSRYRHLQHNIRQALATTDEYVWLWCVRGSWVLRKGWTRTPWNETFPGFLTFLENAKDSTFVDKCYARFCAGAMQPIALKPNTYQDPKDSGKLTVTSAEGVAKGSIQYLKDGVKPGEDYFVTYQAKGSGIEDAMVVFRKNGKWNYCRRAIAVPCRVPTADGGRVAYALFSVPEGAESFGLRFGVKQKADERFELSNVAICPVDYTDRSN